MRDEERDTPLGFLLQGSLEDQGVDELGTGVSQAVGWRLDRARRLGGHQPSARNGQLTWLAWGAATNKTGPCLGTFQEPLGWTSRKKRSTKMDMNHRKVSYFRLLMG